MELEIYYFALFTQNFLKITTLSRFKCSCCALQLQGCRPRGGGAMAPSDFVRSVNSISTREGRLCPPNNTGAPGFSGLPTALHLKRDSSPQDFLYPKILPRSKELSIPRSLKEVRKFGRSVRLRRSREIKEVRNFRG